MSLLEKTICHWNHSFAGDVEDANVNSGRVNGEIVLHYFMDVPSDTVLRFRWSGSFRLCQVGG